MSKLPEGWVNVLLSDVAQWGSGGTPSRTNSAYYSGAIPWVKTGELGQGLIKDTEEKITALGLQNSSAKVFPKGSVLIAMYGATIGKTAILGIDAATNQACAIGIPIKNITTEYLFYYLSSQKNAFIESGKGAAQPNLSQKIIKDWTIPLAPLKEQKRITDKLHELFARVDACRDRLDRVSFILDRFRQAVLDAATSGELTEDWRTGDSIVNSDNEAIDKLTEFDILDAGYFGNFKFPACWNVARLGEIAEIIGGVTKDAKKQDPADEELPYLRVANVQRGFLDLSEIKTIRVPQRRVEELLLKRGDILFNEGGDIDKLGRGWVWNGEIENCTFQNHVFRVRLYNEAFAPKFFSWYGNLRGANYFLSVGKQTTNLASINKSLLSALPVVVPPAEEQREIVRRAELLFAYADRLEARYRNAYDQIEQLIPSLLDKAFKGELVLQDPNDEPASTLLERIQAERNRMESEQKATRTNRRTTKEETEKAPAKQSLDYLEALRVTFERLGNQADARQLFDQAGFNPAEVVQFYEVLRAIPEVRDAFKSSAQELLPREQSLVTQSVNKSPSENGHFRLVELWLEEFKNLADYTVRFDPSHSIDIVLGWNGTGKSNLFEALVIIFRDLHKWQEKNQWPKRPMKGYRLRYVMDGKTIEVFWHPGEIKRPKVTMMPLQNDTEEQDKPKVMKRDQLPLPRFVFGYYSGPTNRLAEHFLPMKQDHYERLLKATSDDPGTLAHLLEQRRFFCAENHHAKYVLLAFCHKEDADISQFLEDRLRIVGFESALFIIRKPRWAKVGQTAEDFWGAAGIMRRVMERLRRFAIAPMVVEQTIPDGFRSKREDHYYFFLPDLQSLHSFAAEYQDARTFFLALESTDFSELIYDVKIQVRVKATNTEVVPITFHELSEGEQQLLMVLGLMRFTKSHQSLVLLDEPDTHLNPHWSVEYLKLLDRVMSEGSSESKEQQTSQILMSTHDPLVIASLFKEQIHLLRRDWQTGVCKWDQSTVNPRGLGYTGILTSEMFGMRSDLDEETLADLDNKVRLVAKEGDLTPNEFVELEEINKRLEDAGFQKAFSDPYYAAFVRAWGQRHSELMAGVRFLNPSQQQEVDRIARDVLEEVMAELQAEAVR